MARLEYRACAPFAVVILLSFMSGVCSFSFKKPPTRFANTPLHSNFVFDCSTDDLNANISLYKRPKPTGGESGWKKLIPDRTKILKTSTGIFTVMDIALKDAGQYQCRAVNQAGIKIKWPRLTGLIFIEKFTMPQVTVGPTHAMIITAGDSFNFTCTSAPLTKLKWLKKPDGGSEVDVPSSKTLSYKTSSKEVLLLMLSNAQPSDSATYKCLMSFNRRSTYRLVTLIVFKKGLPVIESYTGKAQVINMQEPASKELICKATGHPAPSIKWLKDNKEITIRDCDVSKHLKCDDNKKYIIQLKSTVITVHEQSLTIRNMVFPEDHGNYTCVAYNSVGTTMASTFINVEVKPVLSERTAEFLQSKGSIGEVLCKTVRSNPLPVFKWEYQNKDPSCVQSLSECPPVSFRWQRVRSFTVSPIITAPTNTSKVSIPAKLEAAYFRCTATNKIGSSKWTVKFQRIGTSDKRPLEILKPGKAKTIIVDEAQTIIIRCVALTQLAQWSQGIRWYQGDRWMSPKTDPRVNISTNEFENKMTTEVIFTLVNATVNDTGIYTCDAYIWRMQGKVVNDTIMVNVLAVTTPEISPMKDQIVKKEKTQIVKLNCNATGHPTPRITWYKQTRKRWKQLSISPILASSHCSRSYSGYYFFEKQKGNPLVICLPAHKKHSGKYKCTATNKQGSDESTVVLDVLEGANIRSPKPGKIPLILGTVLNKTCIATGNPIPEVQWTRSSESGPIVLGSGRGKAVLLIDELTDEDFVNYTCTATNYRTHTVTLTIEESIEGIVLANKSSLSGGVLAGIITGCAAFVVLILIICFVIYRRQKKQIDEYKEFYFLRTGQSDYKIDPDRSLLEQCNNLPYDMDWEFPEERLIVGKVLGQGAFGQVLRAEAIGMVEFNPRDKTPEALKRRSKMRRSIRGSVRKRNDYASMRATKTTVAVKCLKEGASESDYKDLASELKILIHLGEHRNIMNVLGACTRGRRLMLIIEFAPHGNLLSFLRARRDVYQPTWTKTTSDPEKEYSLVDLAMASYQVSKGVEFLASRKCVHRDLAARNVLVGPDYMMKVSDFGLARDIYQDDLYVKNTSGLLPVKWMALESLFDRVYTEKSDVWSFGILLWEIFTLGGTPYPGLPTEQLLDYLSEGQRMTQPQNCPLDIYTIMRDCWMQLPDQRPSFATLADKLGKVLERNVAKDNPYIQLMIDESTGTTDYYLNPCDARLHEKANLIEGYEEALPIPLNESSLKYDSPLPTLPPDDIPDEDFANCPLPSIPPSYEEATERKGSSGRNSQSSNESGIDVDEKGRKAEEQCLLVDLPNAHGYVNSSTGRGKGKGKGKNTAESLV